jgi:hypothetical protein
MRTVSKKQKRKSKTLGRSTRREGSKEFPEENYERWSERRKKKRVRNGRG